MGIGRCEWAVVVLCLQVEVSGQHKSCLRVEIVRYEWLLWCWGVGNWKWGQYQSWLWEEVGRLKLGMMDVLVWP